MLRRKWSERMWAELSAELTQEHSPLDVRVANAVRRLWSLDSSERLRAWAPGTVGPAAGVALDGEMQRLQRGSGNKKLLNKKLEAASANSIRNRVGCRPAQLIV